MYESISKNNELENEMTLDMSYFWYSDGSVILIYSVFNTWGSVTYLLSIQYLR